MTESGYDQMRKHVAAFPDMWAKTWIDCSDFAPAVDTDPTSVIMCGMGGSSIGGALLESLIGSEAPIPLALNRSYDVPRWAGPTTLGIFTSYSGNTEETISAFGQAGQLGTQRIAVTTGGRLLELCGREGVPAKRIPAGLPPRAALPYTLVPQLHIARYLGLAQIEDDDVDEASEQLASLSRLEGARRGLSHEVAERLLHRIPVIYSGPGLLSAANVRWRGQIQENSKSLAFGNLYPELNHNEIVGWQASPSTAGEIVVIELADADDAPAIRKRMDLTRDLLEDKAADWIRIEAQGRGRLARMMWTVLLGDWVSLYLADAKRVDPMPVELIDALKSGLAAPDEG